MRVLSARSPTHYKSSIILCLNQSVMQPDEVFMLPGNGELWLLERAKCGLETDSILKCFVKKAGNISTNTITEYF